MDGKGNNLHAVRDTELNIYHGQATEGSRDTGWWTSRVLILCDNLDGMVIFF